MQKGYNMENIYTHYDQLPLVLNAATNNFCWWLQGGAYKTAFLLGEDISVCFVNQNLIFRLFRHTTNQLGGK